MHLRWLYFNQIIKILKLIIRDTRADAQTTKKVFEDLIDNDIRIFIGPL